MRRNLTNDNLQPEFTPRPESRRPETRPAPLLELDPADFGVTKEPKLKRPRRFNASQLAGAGVELLDAARMHMRCMKCSRVWWPHLQRYQGKLPRGYWKCPNGCNEGAE